MRAVLVSLRSPDDPMVEQERRCFQERAGLEHLEMVPAPITVLGQRELDADLLFFGGSGAFSVLDQHAWVRRTLDFLVDVVEAGTPAWASCFGYQGLALALGGRVVHDMDRQRLGVFRILRTADSASDPLLKELPPSFYAQLGHHDHVDELPNGVTVLACDDQGRPEAFRVDGSNFWGAQFHPELDKATTYERFAHYRALYAPDEGDAIDREMRASPETPEPARILRALVRFAADRAGQKATLPP